jgi:hypothetical protein
MPGNLAKQRANLSSDQDQCDRSGDGYLESGLDLDLEAGALERLHGDLHLGDATTTPTPRRRRSRRAREGWRRILFSSVLRV